MGDWSATVPSILAGDVPTGADWQAVLDELTAIQGAWTTYAVVWTTGGTAPALGNGSLTGSYRRVGKAVDAQIVLTAGSTTTFGTQFWSFSLPVTAARTQQVGACVLNDASVNQLAGSSLIFATTTVTPVGSTGSVTNVIPFTWTTNDQCRIMITYEVA